MDCDDLETEQNELEEHFILRLPLEEADFIRNLLKTKPEKVKKNLKIALDVTKRTGSVVVGKKKLDAHLRKLPTILESYKTSIGQDRANLYKTGDVCHILECHNEDTGSLRKEMLHGYTAPLKNVKKKRFRKTLVNPEVAEEADAISKELYYLLSTDLEATSTRFKIIYEPKPTNDEVNGGKITMENNLFGGGLSSDSESD